MVGLPACRLSSAAFPCPCSCHRKHPACRGQSTARLICIALLQHLADSKLVEKRHEIDIADGLRPLRMAGAMKVAEGVTTIEEVLRATPAWDG